MQDNNYPIFAKEGRVHLTIALIAGIVATWFLGWWSIVIWILVLFVIQFFRDPGRKISPVSGAVVAPASGKVVAIGEEANPYLEGVRSIKISIFMNVFSVHSNLIPISGTVKGCWYHRGKFFNAALDKASSENERNAIWVRTEGDEDIVFVQIAGLVARRILCYIKSDDKVFTGQRYGFIRFGSRVDLYLPIGTPLNVKLDQWVTSGNDVVANFPE